MAAEIHGETSEMNDPESRRDMVVRVNSILHDHSPDSRVKKQSSRSRLYAAILCADDDMKRMRMLRRANAAAMQGGN